MAQAWRGTGVRDLSGVLFRGKSAGVPWSLAPRSLRANKATTSARRQVAYGTSAVWAHEDSHSMCSPVSAVPLGLRRPSALMLTCRAHKGQINLPSRARMSRPHLPLPPSLPRPPRPAASVSPTEETAPAVVTAASPTSIPSSETTTPSPGASPPAPEPEKPPAPESLGTEELPEDGEPDAAELRRRRLQKLESPVAH